MIGLERALEEYGIQQNTLADELGIKKQNITYWLNGKKKIPVKYHTILEKKFNVPISILQSELTELDKILVSKMCLEKMMSEQSFTYEVEEKDEILNKMVKVKKTYKDKALDSRYQDIVTQQKEKQTLMKIRKTMFDIEKQCPLDDMWNAYAERIELFNRFADIVNNTEKIESLYMILDTLDLFLNEPNNNKINLQAKDNTNETEEIINDLYAVFCKHKESFINK